MSLITAEKKARDLLERLGVKDAQSFSSGDLVELANILGLVTYVREDMLKEILKLIEKNYQAGILHGQGFVGSSKHQKLVEDSKTIYSSFERIIKGILNEKIINHKCDQCDEEATLAARDVIEVLSVTEWKQFQPYGDFKYGCDKHPVKSRTYELGDWDYPHDKL